MVEADLLGTSGERGRPGGRGEQRRWRRLRSAREGERNRGGGESSGESEGVRGAAWRLQGVVEASREAGGGRGGIGARHRAASVRGEEEDKGEEEVGWAGWGSWAGSGGLHGEAR